jgi:hypothetical protein
MRRAAARFADPQFCSSSFFGWFEPTAPFRGHLHRHVKAVGGSGKLPRPLSAQEAEAFGLSLARCARAPPLPAFDHLT